MRPFERVYLMLSLVVGPAVCQFDSAAAARLAALGGRTGSFQTLLDSFNSNNNNNNNNGNNGNNGNGHVMLDAEVERASPDTYSLGQYKRVKLQLNKFHALAARKHGQSFQAQADGELALSPLPVNFDDGTEMTANQAILNQVFENDILLTEPQVLSLVAAYEQQQPTAGRRKRKVIASTQWRWRSTTIPYSFALNDAVWQEDIRKGIRLWEAETCFRFVENGAGADRISFFRGSGCYSNIGRVGGTQTISIGYRCELLGIVAHEIGHALGFWHEQSRPDRDGYITLNWARMLGGTAGQFEKRAIGEINDYGGAYDLGSVMHYGPKAFTADWNVNTIDPVDAQYANTYGQRHEISFIDIKQVNNMYCTDGCTGSLPCEHGGYPDPKDCSRCRCPAGLGGRYCNAVQPSNCGGELQATTDWQTLSSPTTQRNQQCYWRITSPPGTRVMFETSSHSYPCVTTCASYLEVKGRANVEPVGARFCCRGVGLTYADANQLLLIHRTSSGIDTNWRGFTGRYKYYGTAPITTTTTQAPAQSWWSGWSGWSGCSASCGACGTRQRTRTCSGAGCSQSTERQTQTCGTTACQSTGTTTTTVSSRCDGVVKVPCSLLRRLRFQGGDGAGADQAYIDMLRAMSGDTDWDVDDQDVDASGQRLTELGEVQVQRTETAGRRRRRRQTSTICEVPFTYRCNVSDGSTGGGTSSYYCCSGRSLSGTTCV